MKLGGEYLFIHHAGFPLDHYHLETCFLQSQKLCFSYYYYLITFFPPFVLSLLANSCYSYVGLLKLFFLFSYLLIFLSLLCSTSWTFCSTFQMIFLFSSFNVLNDFQLILFLIANQPFLFSNCSFLSVFCSSLTINY